MLAIRKIQITSPSIGVPSSTLLRRILLKRYLSRSPSSDCKNTGRCTFIMPPATVFSFPILSILLVQSDPSLEDGL
jgi:hypothetical protein